MINRSPDGFSEQMQPPGQTDLLDVAVMMESVILNCAMQPTNTIGDMTISRATTRDDAGICLRAVYKNNGTEYSLTVGYAGKVSDDLAKTIGNDVQVEQIHKDTLSVGVIEPPPIALALPNFSSERTVAKFVIDEDGVEVTNVDPRHPVNRSDREVNVTKDDLVRASISLNNFGLLPPDVVAYEGAPLEALGGAKRLSVETVARLAMGPVVVRAGYLSGITDQYTPSPPSIDYRY